MLESEMCNAEYCTGCSACANRCEQRAIFMKEDEKGFFRPVINQGLCINCGACIRTCPQNKRIVPHLENKAYAALAINDTLRDNSSSGGIFSLLAEQTLRKGGVVFGAAFCDGLEVRHIMVDSVDKLSALRGSKYVQSNIGDSYKQVKNNLESGKKVLFSGTPCQIDGLHHYLNKSYENLLTIGIICHGVPSPSVLNKFIESKESETGNEFLIPIYLIFRNFLKFGQNETHG